MDNFRKMPISVICLGSHPGIIQSMLDYHYCLGQEDIPIMAIIGSGRKQERYFWGHSEIVLPVYRELSTVPKEIRDSVTCLLHVQSARRVLSGLTEAFKTLPKLTLVNVFAEQVPEAHAITLAQLAKEHNITIAGPASVGLLLPGVLKLGAIGGTEYPQLVAARIFVLGDTAVISTSGGMVNELIHIVTGSGSGVSFAMALGGDRNPITTPAEAMRLAQTDSQTKRIVYFGELGGDDEYRIAELIKEGTLTKPIVAYIAGSVAELFPEPPQFGHAKAMAGSEAETAAAKKTALREAGATVVDVFMDIVSALGESSPATEPQEHRQITTRHKRLLVSRISGEVEGDVQLLGQDLLGVVNGNTVAGLYLSMLLGQPVKASKLIEFMDYTLRLLIDHGPYVAGAVNTAIAARAGKDLASSLSAGLLTIGPRFGGAINSAAGVWLEGVQSQSSAKDFVVSFRSNGGIIPGIGHKKYRIDVPDPRVVKLISTFSGNSNDDRFLSFARSVESVTTAKKGNLILNVDGTVAAIMLDLLESELYYTQERLQELIDIEFFNALFIASRSVGLMAHYLDQRRHDEGLLRLSDEDVSYIP
jgi:ATP citrate (pro-S)-lyase